MDKKHDTDVTAVLLELRDGNQAVANQLAEKLYPEICRLARRLLRNERPDHSFQSSDLAHEAYLRLVDQSRVDWRDRAHFLAAAATTMRRLLVDAARRRGAAKRGHSWRRVSLVEVRLPGVPAFDILDLEDALGRLAAVRDRLARIAVMRVFGGLEPQEIAEVLKVSRRTVERDWVAARAFNHTSLMSSTQRFRH